MRYHLLLLLLAGSVPAPASPHGVPNIGSRLEMFVDRHLVDRLSGTARMMLHPPVFKDVAVKFDRPWEGAVSGFVAVIKDGDICRMYYVGIPYRVRSDNQDTSFCYAESRDGGITWTKPDLGLVDYQGSKRNNILLAWDPKEGYVHNLSPFLDNRPGVPAAERYKAVGSGSNGWPERILYTVASPDGIHWKKLGQSEKFTVGRFDTQNVAFWSETENCYVLYCREYLAKDPEWDLARRMAEGPSPGDPGPSAQKNTVRDRSLDHNWNYDQGFRTIVKATSNDAVHWVEQKRMSFGNTPMEELYTFHATPYFRAPHMIIGAPMRYVPGRKAMTWEEFESVNMIPTYGHSPGVFNSVSDTVLITSRGGYKFDREFMEAYIRPGVDLRNWASRHGMTGTGYIQTGPAEMSIFVQEHYAQPTARISRFVSRLDGFASVNAGYAGGEMVTKPFVFAGRDLVLNFSTSAAGSISVEVQDADGEPIPGFTLEEAELIVGDRIARKVHWRQGDMGQFAGRPIRLRFVLKDADLYSIRFQ
jgi:hypothetical protein